MRKLKSIDQAIAAVESIISKNRHSLTEDEVRCLFEVTTILKEYKDESNGGRYLNPQLAQKAIEILLRFLLDVDTLDRLKDLVS